MEDNGYIYIHKVTQIVTTLKSRKKFSIGRIPKNVMNTDILSILYSKPLRKLRKPKFKIGDRVRIWKYDLPFRKGYKPQFTQEVFEIIAYSSRKPPADTVKDEQDEVIRGKVYQKELIKAIQHCKRLRWSWFSNASAQLFSDNTLSSFTNLLPEQQNLEGQ